MSNPNLEIDVLVSLRDALYQRTAAEKRVELRRVTADAEPEATIDISPERTNLVAETQNAYDYLMEVNVDLGAPADEPDAMIEMLRLHAEVNRYLVPLAERNLDLKCVIKVDRTGAEELTVGEGQTVKMVRRTTWEVQYRSPRTE